MVTMHISNKSWQAGKPACREKVDNMFATSGQLLVDDHFSWRCSCIKDSSSTRHASTSLSFSHIFSSSPSNSYPNNWSVPWLSLPMRMAGQKLLKHYPMFDRAATKLLLHVGTPKIVERYHHTSSRQKLLIFNRKILRVICHHVFFTPFLEMQWRVVMILRSKQYPNQAKLLKAC